MTEVVGPRTVVPPNPADKGSVYTPLWAAWVLAFALIEGKALWDEAHAARGNRIKRTLSAHLRWVGAYDSPTGIPVGVPYGKLRRLALASAMMWLGRHLSREGEM